MNKCKVEQGKMRHGVLVGQCNVLPRAAFQPRSVMFRFNWLPKTAAIGGDFYFSLFQKTKATQFMLRAKRAGVLVIQNTSKSKMPPQGQTNPT